MEELKKRFYLGGWEVYRKSQGGTLELERETLHIIDDERRIALVDSLTVDNASVLTSPTQLIRYQRDDETGLYYYGARCYTSWLARFVSIDPLKDDYPQLSPFNYADNNPVSDLDYRWNAKYQDTKKKQVAKTCKGFIQR